LRKDAEGVLASARYQHESSFAEHDFKRDHSDSSRGQVRRPPVIILFVLTRNEAALLRLNLAHHLSWGFDHVAVADNQITDATPDVLRQFGDSVTAMRIDDPYHRYLALSQLFQQIEARHGAVDWCAVSDTDEFWWAPDRDLRDVLSDVADAAVAISSDQKLFLPTEADEPTGPVYCRHVYRTSGPKSPLHTSYRAGKSFYRGAWLRTHAITSPHWSATVSHALVRFEQLYPLSDEEIGRALAPYPARTPAVWVQEEPRNMGARRYLRLRFGNSLLGKYPLHEVSRAAAASPASGSAASHKIEQEEILERAFGPMDKISHTR